MHFEEWLRTVCFQPPTPEAEDLAKTAWDHQGKRIAELGAENANLLRANLDGVDWYKQSREEADRYREALVWALGAGGDFPLRETNQGFYWWRSELQKRAGLEWDGEKFTG